MDILYVIGPTPGHDRELRWSLRSVARFARNLGRVVVAGYPPSWLSDEVATLLVRDEPRESKFVSIRRKVLAACASGLLRGEFLLSADDNFYTAPVDLDATPFWYRRDLPEISEGWPEDGSRNYREHLDNTRATLAAAGYGVRDCASHCNTRCDVADLPVVRDLCLAPGGTFPHRAQDMASMFCNVRDRREPLAWVRRQDIKLRSFDAAAVQSGQFSIDDPALRDRRMLDWFAATYPDRSPFERP